MVEVTQADREAAADFAIQRGLCSELDRDAIVGGKWDDWDVIQAFAAHRIAALEEAAKVAERYDDGSLGIVQTRQAIATAIRNLGNPKS